MSAGEQTLRSDTQPRASACCPLYHEAVEMVGRRWTGAILRVLMDGALRFSEVAQAVPELSDRLLSERMKELEARGIVERTVLPGPPVRVEYVALADGSRARARLGRAAAMGQPLAGLTAPKPDRRRGSLTAPPQA